MKNTKAQATTALSMPKINAVQPKPTKTEIVDAMIVRAKVKHDADNAARKKLRDNLHKKAEQEAIKAHKQKDASPRVVIYEHSGYAEIEYRVKTPQLKAIIDEINANSRIVWDEKQMRKAISDEIAGRKPNRLLDNPDHVRAIDAMLEEWGL